MNDAYSIRIASESDQPEIIRLIRDVYAEYGEPICLEDADADLLDLSAHYFSRGGQFWVLETELGVEGTHAAVPVDARECTFRRLYLAPRWRGGTAAEILMDQTLEWAREHGFELVQFWSDTRFERAHRFFAKCGFHRTGEVRTMLDSFEPYHEYRFARDLDPPSS